MFHFTDEVVSLFDNAADGRDLPRNFLGCFLDHVGSFGIWTPIPMKVLSLSQHSDDRAQDAARLVSACSQPVVAEEQQPDGKSELTSEAKMRTQDLQMG